MQELSKEWFELTDYRQRRFSRSAWIPVYGTVYEMQQKKYPEIGHIEEKLIVGSAVIFQDKQEDVERISDWFNWSPKDTTAWIHDDGNYYGAGEFLSGNLDKLGFRLVLAQHHNSLHPQEVMLHQDFVLAYGLLQEENTWLRPSEGYEKVARQQTNEEGEPTLIEIRAEYLKDYLAARNATLRIYYHCFRVAVLENDPGFDWPDNHYLVKEIHNQCRVRCYEVDSFGDIPEATWTIFQARRTDVDPEEDIPNFSGRDEDSIDVKTWQGIRKGKGRRFRVSGEMWRGEWIEPVDGPCHILGTEPQEPLFVYVEASDKMVEISQLVHDDSARYLWFNPEVVNALLAKRGARLKWYTKDTGCISPSPSPHSLTHFGVNSLGLINVITADIARLPLWERRIWKAHNCRPDGGVSEELMKAQMECNPAESKSPELLFFKALKHIDRVFYDKFGFVLLGKHHKAVSLAKKIHRFRAIDEDELLRLAKDVVRISIERLNKESLLGALGMKQSKIRTLKLLEKLLAKYTSEDYAYKQMTPLFGVYDLRQGDAHLPSSDIEDCYTRLGIDRDSPHVLQAVDLLQNVAEAFGVAGSELERHIRNK